MPKYLPYPPHKTQPQYFFTRPNSRPYRYWSTGEVSGGGRERWGGGEDGGTNIHIRRSRVQTGQQSGCHRVKLSTSRAVLLLCCSCRHWRPCEISRDLLCPVLSPALSPSCPWLRRAASPQDVQDRVETELTPHKRWRGECLHLNRTPLPHFLYFFASIAFASSVAHSYLFLHSLTVWYNYVTDFFPNGQ